MYLSNYAMIPVQSQYRIFRLFLDFGVFSFHFESPLVRKDFSLLKKRKEELGGGGGCPSPTMASDES